VITRQSAKRALLWCLPPLVGAACWAAGSAMPWENTYLYGIQAILLSLPTYLMYGWPFWTMAAAWRWRGHWIWLFLFSPWWMGQQTAAPGSEPEGIKTIVANVNAFTGHSDELAESIAERSPDIAILLERRTFDVPGMIRVSDDFDTPLERPSHHTAVFCRETCPAWVSPQIGSESMAMPVALVRPAPGICLVGIHAPPPIPLDSSGIRPYIAYLESHIHDGRVRRDWEVCRSGDGVAVIGDLNAVPGSWPYRQLMAAGLTDLLEDSGIWGPTWPFGGGWPALPFFRMDFALAGGVVVEGLHPIQIPGSDHRGLMGWLRSD
jgi:hypothetical protein